MGHRHIGGVLGASVLAGVLLYPLAAPAADAEPVPIPSGAFAPGPRSLRLMGLHVEPGTISNFKGVVALAYLKGSATDATGHRYDLENDMRVMSGDYVSADGSSHRGAFAFI